MASHLDHFHFERLANMLTETFSTRCLQIFFLSGVTPYNPFMSDQKRMQVTPLWNTLPSIGFVSSAYVASYWAIYEGINGEEFDFNYFSYMVFIALIALIVTTVFQRAAFPRSNTHVWDHLLDLERVLRRQIHLDISLDRFRGSYLRKVGCIFMMKCALSVVEFCFTCDSSVREHFCVLLLGLRTRLASVYILFYVDMFNHMVYMVNRQMAHIPNAQWKPSSNSAAAEMHVAPANVIRSQYRTMKDIHFQLWETVVHMNEEFGYILVALVIHYTNYCELILSLIMPTWNMLYRCLTCLSFVSRLVVQTLYWFMVELYNNGATVILLLSKIDMCYL